MLCCPQDWGPVGTTELQEKYKTGDGSRVISPAVSLMDAGNELREREDDTLYCPVSPSLAQPHSLQPTVCLDEMGSKC